MQNFAAQASWISLDAAAYRHNARIFRELLGPKVKLGAVLKGNAYGHGFAQMLPLAHEAADAIYVIDPFDGLAVRAFEASTGAARKQVLVLGAISDDEAVELARAGVDVTLSNPADDAVAALRKAKVKLRAHIHLDTGLGREGFMPAELPARAAWLSAAQDVIQVAGVLSHFANT